MQHITDSKYLIDKVLFLFGHFFRREAFPLDIEFMFFPVRFRFSYALIIEIIFQLLTPVNTARIDYITEKVRRNGIYPDIKHIVALYVFFTGNSEHVFHKTNFVFQYVFFPNVVG